MFQFVLIAIFTLTAAQTTDEPSKDFVYTGPLPISGYSVAQARSSYSGCPYTKSYAIASFIRVNWFAAQQLCAQNGMSLASINSDQENTFLRHYLVNASSSPREFWLSGTNLGDQDEWYWLNNGLPLHYRNWAIGYGSYQFTNDCSNNACLSSLPDGEWKANNCFDRKYFVCEYCEDPVPTATTGYYYTT